jgi:hypothetical protein
VTLVGTHITPACPTLPPEVATPGALLTNNQFAKFASDGGTTNPNDDNGSKNSSPDWESLLDDVEVPPELATDDPRSKAIVKMIQDHRCNANSCILLIRKYFQQKLNAQSDDTLGVIWLEQ